MRADSQLINADGKVTRWPKKPNEREIILTYIASKFETNTTYSESEVNEILRQWHTYNDWSSLRRELVGFGYATRDRYGLEYKFKQLDRG